jgi:hypothetical protein
VQLGLIGLGKMGGNMAERLRRAGHDVVGYDRSSDKRDVDSLPALVEALEAPRVVWVMVPSGEPTRATVKELSELLSSGDIVIDGGNSRFTDDQLHDVMLRETRTTSRPCSRSSTRSSPRPRRTSPARNCRVPASCTPGRWAPGTSARWSTTASSTR